MSILTIVIESEVKNPILRARSEEVADILNTEIKILSRICKIRWQSRKRD